MVDIVGVDPIRFRIGPWVSEIWGSKVRDPRKIATFFFEKITASPLWDSKPRNLFMNMRKRCGYHNLKSASRYTQTKKLENSKTGKFFPKIGKKCQFFFFKEL